MLAAQVAALTSFDRRDELGAISVPTLIIVGAQDRVCHPDLAQELARLIPGSSLVMIKNAGHLVQTEQPEAYAQALLPFLDEG